ncbi:MAG: replication-associated recombination protein A, partial [Verrucomicrobiae bacterium]|nr:replication-associated recombination protein A [Verrucomicrobiae bacterium]
MARDDLFSPAAAPAGTTAPAPDTTAGRPLAARMRPRNLDEYAGQSHILGPGQLLRR